MNLNIPLLVMSLVYLLLILSLFTLKQKPNTIENKIYICLLSSSLIGVILDILGIYSHILLPETSIFRWLVFKFYMMYLLTFSFLLSIYIICIGNKMEMKGTKLRSLFSMKNIKLVLIAYVVCCILNFVLPFEYYNQGTLVYTYGPNCTFLYSVVAIQIVMWIIYVIRKRKIITTKKVVPIITFIVLCVVVILIQLNRPELLLVTSLTSFVVVFMYHTIENPDTKMIQELNKNRLLIEQTNEDKTNFLFRIAQEVKQPIDDIIRASAIMKENKDEEIRNNGIKYIEYNAKNLKSIVNHILGVSAIDSYNIKISSGIYNVSHLFEELFSKYANTVNKKIEFRSNISKNLPKILYGDAVKLKQVISTILENAVEYTKEGFIECNVDAIIKNDVCRLVISIEDSGVGMSIDKVNELLSLDTELTDEDAKQLDQINLNLNIATKIIKLLGGNILIKSEEGKGSEFTVVLEQKIKEANIKRDTKIEEYSNIVFKNKRVLVVDDSKDFLEEITKQFKKYNVEVLSTMYGSDCVEKIKNNQKYDLIILDDEMRPDSGLATLKELKKITKFKTPVIVTLEKGKEPIKEHYIEEGFKDYLLKEKIETETKRIKEEYL